MKLRFPLGLSVLAALLGQIVSPVQAETSAVTDPVGFISDSIPAYSDAALSAPLARDAVFQGVIASISGNTITVAGAPAWQATAPKQFQHVAGSKPNTYYVQIRNGAQAGMVAAITDNSADSVTVQLGAGDSLATVATEATAGVGNGAAIAIVPFWTPATLFSTSWPTNTLVLLYDNDHPGVNNSSSTALFFDGTKWVDNATYLDASELLLYPAEAFVVRNLSNQPISRVTMGCVPTAAHHLVLETVQANQAQDQRIAYNSPTTEVIGNSGLGAEDNDVLLVYDNSAPGYNKSSARTLFYSSGRWIDQDSYLDVTDSFVLPPGASFTYRKAATAQPKTFVWQNLQTYNR